MLRERPITVNILTVIFFCAMIYPDKWFRYETICEAVWKKEAVLERRREP